MMFAHEPLTKHCCDGAPENPDAQIPVAVEPAAVAGKKAFEVFCAAQVSSSTNKINKYKLTITQKLVQNS